MSFDAQTIIHAWRDESYRASLSDAERAQIPVAPEGAATMSDEELGQAAGGVGALPLPAPVDGIVGGVVECVLDRVDQIGASVRQP